MPPSRRHPTLAKAWSVAEASEYPPSATYLSSLVNNSETTKEVLARTALLSAIHSVQGYEQILSNCKHVEEPWAVFVAMATADESMPQCDQFLTALCNAPIQPVDDAAIRAARPNEHATLPSPYEAKVSEEYRLKAPPQKSYLVQLLGKKSAALLDKSLQDESTAVSPTPPWKPTLKSVPITSGVSRRVGRQTRPTAMGSVPAFVDNEDVVPLGGARRFGGLNGKVRSGLNPSSANASQRMRELQKQSGRKSVTVLEDPTALPPPPDTLWARREKKAEDDRKKAEALAAKKARMEDRHRAEMEKNKKKAAKKQAVAKKHRFEMKQYRNEYDDTDEELDEVVAASSSSEDSPHNSRRYKRLVKESEDPNYEPVPPKKARHVSGAYERVPRRKSEHISGSGANGGRAYAGSAAVSGEDVHSSRAALSGTHHRSPYEAPHEGRWGASSRGQNGSPLPRDNRPPYGGRRRASQARNRSPHQLASQFRSTVPIIAPEAMKEETLKRRRCASQREDDISEVETDVFREVVGPMRNSLSAEDKKEIIEFLDSATDHGKFFKPNEKERIYVLHEENEETLVLKAMPDGSWNRVRLRST